MLVKSLNETAAAHLFCFMVVLPKIVLNCPTLPKWRTSGLKVDRVGEYGSIEVREHLRGLPADVPHPHST